MNALTASLVTALVTAILAAAGTYLTTRRNLQIQFDASLRDLRIDAYKRLWKHLEPLAKYGRPDTLVKSDVTKLSQTLRDWYFREGGIFLSVETRGRYFALQDGLEVFGDEDSKPPRAVDDEFLRVLGSRLRTAMTKDVGTRETYRFRDVEVDPHAPGSRAYTRKGVEKPIVVSYTRRLRLPRWLRLEGMRMVEGPTFEPKATEGRQFLDDDGRLLEGPRGWRRGDDRPSAPVVLWTEVL